MLVLSFALLTLFVAGLLVYRVRAVAEGPGCPRCGVVAPASAAEPDPVVAVLLGPDVQSTECAACGWRGRLRRVPVSGLVPSAGLERREDV